MKYDSEIQKITGWTAKQINKWWWSPNQFLGGTIPFHLMGTDRENKVVLAIGDLRKQFPQN